MDGTPIVDIKPYLPYVDSVPDAVGGFTEQTERHHLTVDFPEKLKKYVPKQNLPAVMGLLAQDRARRISMTESACTACRMVRWIFALSSRATR